MTRTTSSPPGSRTRRLVQVVLGLAMVIAGARAIHAGGHGVGWALVVVGLAIAAASAQD